MRDRDTIVARATAMGRAGVGIVRLSGPCAYSIALNLTHQSSLKPRQALYTEFYSRESQISENIDSIEIIDQGLVIFFKNPHSFTGEDVIEFQTHGSPLILDWIIEACIVQGARMARPGEFSERAFLNGKMDLTQAEAVADLINASSREAAKSAVASLSGVFSEKIHRLLKKLIHLRVFIEAMIDFPEEEIDEMSSKSILTQLNILKEETQTIRATARQGEILQEGITIVIVGRPNAGKSSLLNALSGEETAIVADVAGTTRDILKTSIQLSGVPVHVMDTAGLRVTDDFVEQEGVKRAYAAMKKADHILWVLDGNHLEEFPAFEKEILPSLPQEIPLTLLINKIDQIAQIELRHQKSFLEDLFKRYTVLKISAKQRIGLDALAEHLFKQVGFESKTEGQFIARRRHLDALDQVLAFLNSGETQFVHHRALELLAEDLRSAQQSLNKITGDFTSDDLLGEIFSTFCIGK